MNITNILDSKEIKTTIILVNLILRDFTIIAIDAQNLMKTPANQRCTFAFISPKTVMETQQLMVNKPLKLLMG